MNNIINTLTREEVIKRMTLLAPSQILSEIRARNFDDVFRSVYPRLNELEEPVAINYLVCAIKATQDLINVHDVLHDKQWRTAAVYLLEDYGHLTMTDLMLISRLGLTGQLVEFHGRFDAQVIYDWFYAYNIRRDEAKRYREAEL